MDYEKLYKEALKRARQVHTTNVVENKKSAEYIFPELKESEDERIRKEILEYFQQFENEELRGIDISDWIAWLEKQGEQKVSVVDFKAKDWYVSKVDGKIHNMTYNPTDKVEPKFKVGDWIVDKSGLAQQVLDFRGGIYTCTYNSFTTDCESNYHLWTIQDAKDGDVLAVEDKNFATPFVAIYKSLGDTVDEEPTFNSRCFIGFNGEFNTGEEGHVIEGIHPATKEQRDILFTKMHEAGYEWDDEKKEPRVIDWSKHVKCEPIDPSIIEEKSVWTEEDEEELNQLHKLIVKKAFEEYEIDTKDGTLYGKYATLDNWLKSLKERMKGE